MGGLINRASKLTVSSIWAWSLRHFHDSIRHHSSWTCQTRRKQAAAQYPCRLGTNLLLKSYQHSSFNNWRDEMASREACHFTCPRWMLYRVVGLRKIAVLSQFGRTCVHTHCLKKTFRRLRLLSVITMLPGSKQKGLASGYCLCPCQPPCPICKKGQRPTRVWTSPPRKPGRDKKETWFTSWGSSYKYLGIYICIETM